MAVGDLKTDKGVKDLNAYLAERSYIEGWAYLSSVRRFCTTRVRLVGILDVYLLTRQDQTRCSRLSSTLSIVRGQFLRSRHSSAFVSSSFSTFVSRIVIICLYFINFDTSARVSRRRWILFDDISLHPHSRPVSSIFEFQLICYAHIILLFSVSKCFYVFETSIIVDREFLLIYQVGIFIAKRG